MVTVNNETLTTSDFLVLFLINAADCDFEIHKKEIEYIQARYGEDRYFKMKALYEKDKAGSFSHLIRELKTKEHLNKEKNSILKEIHELLHADGIYNDFEKSFYEFFNDV